MSYYKETIIREWAGVFGQSRTYQVKVEATPMGGRKLVMTNTYNGDLITATLTVEETRQLSELLKESADWGLGSAE